jgi:Mrp family chromosome partitioning ATPase
VLLVVSAGSAKPVALASALERLAFVQANLMGIILNQSGDDLEATGGYYYTSPESAGASA